MKSFLVVLGLLAIAATALSAGYTNVTISTCPGLACAQTSTCNNYTVASGTCSYGSRYTCVASLAMCLDMNQYQAGPNCGASALQGPATIECGYCFAIPNATSQPVYAVAQFCHDNTKRKFEYECDSTCQNCKKSVMMPLNECIANPINPAMGNVIFLRARPCKTVVRFAQYAANDCSGAPQDKNSIPANSCTWDTNDKSTEFFCH